MKKILPLAALLVSTSLWADGPQFENLSKNDVKNVAREFSATFSHTGVSAPETDGVWGIEVGVIAGQSKTPELKDVVNASGGDGNDFKNLYHAGIQARAHFPLDLFVEATVLPEQDISDVKVKNRTLEIGWNVGGFFGLPLDLAVGFNVANSDISFSQDATASVPVDSKISMKSKTKMAWVGVGKTFGVVSPYLKLGKVKSDSDVKASNNADIYDYQTSSKESVDNDGNFAAIGANLQFAFFKIGVEGSQIMHVKRATAKISFDF